jgi:hypothetical protein
MWVRLCLGKLEGTLVSEEWVILELLKKPEGFSPLK